VIERGLIGNHTVACKERFLLVTDHSVARHDKVAFSHCMAKWPLYLASTHSLGKAKVFQWQDLLNNRAFFKPFGMPIGHH